MSKFKVGDRVRRTIDSEFRGHGMAGTTGVVVDVGAAVIDIIDDSTGDRLYGCSVSLGGFELISPALTIQAGKFYKTRDGRKVGPMVWREDYRDFIVSVGDGYAWGREGKDKYPGRGEDLVAEWVDEPVASATAPFKVGDRVRCVRDYPGQFTKGKEYVVQYYDSEGSRLGVVSDDEGDENGLGASCFEPITIKVGDWVRTDNGVIGIVLHDDGSDCLQFKVGFVGDDNDEHWDWHSDLQLTVVPPGTAKASNDNAPILAEIGELEQRLSDLRAKLAA